MSFSESFYFIANIYKLHYLKFLLKSSNAHGVHSPFVYDLVTKCFYNKKKQAVSVNNISKEFKKKHLETLNDMLHYFNVRKAYYFVSEKHFIHTLPNGKLIVTEGSFKADLVYVDQKKQTLDTILKAFNNLSKRGMLIIEQPYKNLEVWENVKSNAKAQVVVDTYFFGIIFLRTIQAKEIFHIRL